MFPSLDSKLAQRLISGLLCTDARGEVVLRFRYHRRVSNVHDTVNVCFLISDTQEGLSAMACLPWRFRAHCNKIAHGQVVLVCPIQLALHARRDLAAAESDLVAVFDD